MFPPELLQAASDINGRELATVMVALKIWGSGFLGRRIKIHCDNLVSVCVINRNRTRDSFLQDCMREIIYVAAAFKFEIRAEHIRSAGVL